MEYQNTNQKTWLTPDDVEQEYGFKKANQAIMRSNRKIPYHKVGGYVRYSREELDSWIRSHSVPVLEEQQEVLS